ncbi:MAG: RdgB/HAM1 family non-canonical purine NTP pyrophosphatase [Anaerohalosphaeraceae bacterium]|nr:RdgB/HAM1 family non-canonical purine NTP pyrophosphatase [Anaerohalosphaeraceae bacterium]
MKILVATTNPGKMAELKALLDTNIQWLSLADFPDTKEVPENGEAFAENARAKAIGYSKQTGLWTVADDSGLVVDALGGEPGVHSARFSSEKENSRELLDHKNMTKVLELLAGVETEKRTARFVCNICMADGEKVLIETQGTMEGVIAEKEIGNNGFGYDPIFFLPQMNKTVAQLAKEEKNLISHRAQAIANFKKQLAVFF